MTQPRRKMIVVGTDFSPAAGRALEWAAWLATRRRAALRIVHAVSCPETVDGAVELPPDLAAELVAAARERLATVVGELRPYAWRVSWEVTVGSPESVLVDAAARCRAELLVIGARGLDGWRYPLLGTHARRLLGRAPCPVLAVHPADPPPAGEAWRVLAATDFSPDAVRAVRAAVRLLGPQVGEVVLLHVLPPPPFDPAEGGTASAATAILRETARDRALAQLAVDAEALRRSGVAVRTELVEGVRPQAILEAADRLAAELLVMGGRGRGGVEHLLLGSTVEPVAQHARRPLLVFPRTAKPPAGAVLERRESAAARLPSGAPVSV